MMKLRIAASIMILPLLSAVPLKAETALVAAASSMKFAIDELVLEFHQRRPEIQINVSFGSSGNFHSQIINGAPYDIFFSADSEYPRRLKEAGLAMPGGGLYAFGKIVLWVGTGPDVNLREEKMKTLLNPAVKKIAVANPRHAPYGKAAVESLKHFAVYERVKDRLVFGENVSQAAQFAASGAAQAGIIALSLALNRKMKDSGTYWEIPPDAYRPLAQEFLVLKNGKNPRAAKTFAEFVIGTKGQDILKRHGFRVPGDNSP